MRRYRIQLPLWLRQRDRRYEVRTAERWRRLCLRWRQMFGKFHRFQRSNLQCNTKRYRQLTTQANDCGLRHNIWGCCEKARTWLVFETLIQCSRQKWRNIGLPKWKSNLKPSTVIWSLSRIKLTGNNDHFRLTQTNYKFWGLLTSLQVKIRLDLRGFFETA